MNTGGPAFPTHKIACDQDGAISGFSVNDSGMTLRDYFAAKALPIVYQYWINDFHHPDFEDAEDRNADGRTDFDTSTKTLIAEDCYAMADAMLEARK